MKRFLIAVALCAITAASGAWTLHWNADSGWPAGTTVAACLNGVCVNGVTGTSQYFSEVYPPGTVLHGTAQAVPPVGYQCGEPPTPCPPSSIAEISQTIPADQQRPDNSAWVTSSLTTGGGMAGFDFVTGSFVSTYSTGYISSPSVNTAVAAQSGDVILLVVSFDAGGSPTLSSVSSTNTTWTQVIDFSHTGNNQIFRLWKGVVSGSISSGSAITANLSSAQWVSLQAAIFRSDSGSAANPVQTAAYTLYDGWGNPTSTNGMSVTVAPTGTNPLTIVEILEMEDTPGATADSSPGTGFTQISEGDIFPGQLGPYLWAIKTGASAGSQSVTATYAQNCESQSSITAAVLEGGSSSAYSLPIGINQYSYSALLGR